MSLKSVISNISKKLSTFNTDLFNNAKQIDELSKIKRLLLCVSDDKAVCLLYDDLTSVFTDLKAHKILTTDDFKPSDVLKLSETDLVLIPTDHKKLSTELDLLLFANNLDHINAYELK